MWKIMNNKIKEENKDLRERNHFLELKVEQLEKENKKIIEDFVKKYRYVITTDGGIYSHIYQDGIEIKRVKSIKYEHTIHEEIPEIEVVVQ